MDNLDQFKQEAKMFVNHTIKYLNAINIGDNFYAAIKKIAECDGIVVTTGMGKNSHIARKIASTLSSLMIPSSFLHPGEALHGDSGIIRKQDILLVFSTSGKTDEIIKTIQVARQLGISCVISLTSHMDSPIRKMSDITIDIGEITEAGYLGLAPTTSIMAMLLSGDILATFAAKMNIVTRQDFHIRHHSGYLAMKSCD